MSPKINIGIDLLGSDSDPIDLLSSTIVLCKTLDTSINFKLFGNKELEKEFNKFDFSINNHASLEFILSENEITMDEDPLLAVRRKKKSSLCIAMRSLKNKEIDALVSCGNTGAITASSIIYLDCLKNISRPALLAIIPTKKNPCAILDVGANISATSDQLVEHAILGISYKKTKGYKKPKVGILNIGTEEKKGTSKHKQAYQDLLKLSKEDTSFEFMGNIEGKEVFLGKVDILITDGFTGNIFLKTAEGLASFILDKIYNNLTKEEFLDISNVFNDLQKRLHYAQYPGALLIGVNGIVIKCHGYSSSTAFASAIKGAINFVKQNFLDSIKSNLK
ncbi:MAG: Phosphate acyltransferase [Candidatus Anoxychlamydiales bacterium]|nr:Phosphate acyltransferase [Candidatus Anoxychlamydiales bacterium]